MLKSGVFTSLFVRVYVCDGVGGGVPVKCGCAKHFATMKKRGTRTAPGELGISGVSGVCGTWGVWVILCLAKAVADA